MKRKIGFTLAEVLITLAIIGVVAALTIPSVVANTQQQEFKTGLKKAVSVLNSAITMNMAIDGESPYENENLFAYLQRHMSVIESTTYLGAKFTVKVNSAPSNGMVANSAFYTTDGMRFELTNTWNYNNPKLYESSTYLCRAYEVCGGCGSYGLTNNPDATIKPPCLVMVDVNGDRKPSPSNVNCRVTPVSGNQQEPCMQNNFYKLSDPAGKKLSDVFNIMITDKQAIPYGVAAQKAMYEAQK